VTEAFVPAWWLPGPHLQTVGARVTRSTHGVRLTRERLDTPDGDFLDLDWASVDGRADGEPRADPARGPLAVVLHGLEGSAASGYALETYRQLASHGVQAVGLNFRSCSGELNRAARLYHSGETGDLRFVLATLGARFPGQALAAVGFSLGGNVLLKYLGEEGRLGRAGQPLRVAAAVSVPYDLAAGATYTERGFVRAYVWRLLRSLKAKVRAKEAQIGELVDVPGALAARTFRTFDEAATAPLHGFAGADDYYARCSSGPFLESIGVPTRLIHAADDPFLPSTAVPRLSGGRSPKLETRFTATGGHVGFVTGPPWARVYWAERQAALFVAEHTCAASHG
jgi:predicted alpha/beta-fold hydrolase